MPRDVKNIQKYQFVKGQSGNPAGSKKGHVKLRYHLAKVLATKVSVKDGDKMIKLTAADLIIDQLFLKASKGNMEAIKLIFQYVEGMPVQAIKTGDGLTAPTINVQINRFADGNKLTD